MHIVYATHKTDEYLGVNKYFYLLANQVQRLGYTVSVIVDSSIGAKVVKMINPDIKVLLNMPLAKGVAKTLLYCKNIADYLQDYDFDILHCGHVLPCLYLAKSEHKKVVFQPFGNELFTLAGRGMPKWYCKLAQPVLRYCGNNADMVVSEGVFQHEEMRKYYPKMKQIKSLPVGVECSNYIPKQNYEVNGTFNLLTVNSLLPYENIDVLIEAIRDMPVHLTIVGSGFLEDKLKKQAEGLPVTFLKNISEEHLASLYNNSDAFVCTTRETDYQMGVLEAMATGLPVISTKANWLPKQVVTHSGSMISISVAIKYLMSSTILERRERGLDLRSSALQHDFKNIAVRAISLYEYLCRN